MRSQKTSFAALLCLLIAVGTCAGLFGGWKRYHAESRNRRVELAFELAELRSLAQSAGVSTAAVLEQFRAAGVTSLALSEQTLAGLEAQGELRPRRTNGHETLVELTDPSLLARLEAACARRGIAVGTAGDNAAVNGDSRTRFRLLDANGGMVRDVFLPNRDYALLRPLGIGLNPDEIALAQQTRLAVVGRIANFPGANATTMENELTYLKSQGVQTVVFLGNDVLGFRGLHLDTAAILQRLDMHYGQIEFGKQKGDESLAIALKGDYVRVHSISEAEMGQMDENEAIERFVRAARERNIRLCYLRLVTTLGDDPVQTNLDYVAKIKQGISRNGEMRFGTAHPFLDPGVSKIVFALIGIGTAGGLVLLLTHLTPVSARLTLAALVLALLGCVSLTLMPGETGRRLVALLAALVFPTLACLRRDLLGSESGLTVVSRGAAARQAVNGIFFASLVTFLGIAHVVGLLASRPFLLKANQFLGIKAAHALPLLLIGALAIVRLPRLDRSWADEWTSLRDRTRHFFAEPTRVGQLLLAVLALLAFALIVARTGNEPGVGVSGIELRFRSLLDRVLPVRPRTKEFLIGHPAFVLAIALAWRGKRHFALPLFVVGVIGQVSLLNTFCHIHTPLLLSFIRDVTGLVLGTLIGLAAFWVLDRLLPASVAPTPSVEQSIVTAIPESRAAVPPAAVPPAPVRRQAGEGV